MASLARPSRPWPPSWPTSATSTYTPALSCGRSLWTHCSDSATNYDTLTLGSSFRAFYWTCVLYRVLKNHCSVVSNSENFNWGRQILDHYDLWQTYQQNKWTTDGHEEIFTSNNNLPPVIQRHPVGHQLYREEQGAVQGAGPRDCLLRAWDLALQEGKRITFASLRVKVLLMIFIIAFLLWIVIDLPSSSC